MDGPAVTTPDRRLQQGNDQTYPDPDVDTYDSQPTRLNQDWRAIVDRHVRAGQAEVSRVAKLEQAQALNAVGKLAEAEVPFRSRRRPVPRWPPERLAKSWQRSITTTAQTESASSSG